MASEVARNTAPIVQEDGAVPGGHRPEVIIASGGGGAATIADGADVAEGATADTAATAGGTGTISAKLRLMTTQLGTLATSLVNLLTGIILAAGEAHIGSVGGNTSLISPTVTVSTTPAYTAGDVVGGILTLTNAMRTSGGTGILESIFINDASNQKAALDIYIFDSNPAAGTYTDNAAVVFSTDLTKLIARIPVAAADYVTNNSQATAHEKAIGAIMKASGSANLFAVIVTSGTPTYAATTAITIRFGSLQD